MQALNSEWSLYVFQVSEMEHLEQLLDVPFLQLGTSSGCSKCSISETSSGYFTYKLSAEMMLQVDEIKNLERSIFQVAKMEHLQGSLDVLKSREGTS